MVARRTLVATTVKNTPVHAALLASFSRHLRAEGKEPKTEETYLESSRMFLRFAEDENLPAIANIKREHIELWLASLYAKFARATVRNRFVGLQQFMHWLIDEGEIRSNPMDRIKRPVLDETSKDVVPSNELLKAFAALEKQKRWRDCAVLAIFYDTGIRETELADSLTDNLDMETGYLVLPKTKNKSRRTVRVSPKGLRYIDRYFRTPRKQPEWLINGLRGKMTGSGLYQLVRSIFEAMGYKALIGPHDLRHTSATHAAGEMDEAQLMRLYGWKDREMARHYTEQVQDKLALDAHRRASPLERLYRKE